MKQHFNFNFIRKEQVKRILIFLALTIFACAPYLNKQSIFSWDLSYHLNRILEIASNLAEGQFPVLIHTHLMGGLGYANSLFYPELFLYLPAMLTLWGVGTMASYKIFLMIITFCTFLFMDMTARKIFKNNKIAYASSILYTLSLYRLMDIYVRGALGEILAIAFSPLLIYGIYDIIFDNGKKWWVLAIGLFGIANSHILSLAFAGFMILFFCIINVKRIIQNKTILIILIKTGIVSILICMSVILPIWEQYRHISLKVQTDNSGFKLEDQAITLTSALENELRAGSSQNGDTTPKDQMMTVGAGIMLLALPFLLLFKKEQIKEGLYDNKEKDKPFMFVLQMLGLGIICFFLTTKMFPWKYFEWMATIQFPWRFNMIVIVCLSLVSAYAIYHAFAHKRESTMMTIFVIIIMIIMASQWLQTVDINPLNYDDEQLISYTPVGNGEYLPQNINLAIDNSQVVDLEKNKTIVFTREKGTLTFDVTQEEGNQFEVPLIYYKGYKAYLKDKEDKRYPLSVQLDQGRGLAIVSKAENQEGTILIKYKMTKIQIIAYFLTLSAFVFMVVNQKYIKKRRKKS